MSDSKKYYYVLVFTSNGPKFVTDTSYNTAKWDINKSPLCFPSAKIVSEIALGLTANGHYAVGCCSRFEIDGHPYNYNDYEINFTPKENNNENK